MVPIKVKNGMASNKSLDKIPKTFSGKAVMNSIGNQPCETAKKPQAKPNADSEKATGKPMHRIRIRPPNIIGAKVCMFIGAVFRSGNQRRIRGAARPPA